MKQIRNILGAVLVLSGGIWTLQGLNLLPGSFMTGQTQWAVYGMISIAIGAGLLAYTARR
jgi:hypothetical protein